MRENKMNQIRKKVKKGFTLMELLMVIAISGILAALAVVGVFHFNQTLKIMELNNTAEEIFIAAQNHLTALQANSSAATLFDQEKGDKSQWGTPVSAENAPKDIKDAQGDTKGIYAFDNSGKGNNNGAALREMILPYGAIDSTVADGGSWIIEYYPETYTVCCVFYTDGKSTVLGSKSTRTISTADTVELNKLANGEETKISKFPENGDGTTVAVGYYSGLNGEKLSQTDISGDISLELHNEEILYGTLKFNDVQVTRSKESGNSDASTNAPDLRLVISVEGRTSGKKAAFSGTISSTGKVSLKGSSENDIVLKTGNFSYSGGKAAGEINFVLDDITASGYHFAELFPGFIPGEKISVSASLSAATDAKTATLSDLLESNTEDVNSIFGSLSAHSKDGVKTETASIENFRHLENLSPEVSHVAGMTKADSKAEKVLSLTTSGSTYKDGKFRLAAELSRSLIHGKKHDYSWNGFLSKTEEIKNGSSKSEDGTGSSSSSGSSAEKTADKAADKTTDKTTDTTTDKTADKTSDTTTDTTTDKTTDTITGKASDQTAGSKSSSVKIYCGTSKSSAAGSYVPVNNNYLTEFDGNKKTIEGVMISSEDQNHEARGLFGTFAPAYDAEIKNLYIRNFDISAENSNDKVTYAGSLAGYVYPQENSAVSISGIHIYEKNHNTYCGIWASADNTINRNGGLIGEVSTERDEKSISIDGCSASVYVQSSYKSTNKLNSMSISGGLIGRLTTGDKGGNITVSDSYVGGHTVGASSTYSKSDKVRGEKGEGRNVTSGGIAGGFAGAVYAGSTGTITVNNCYTTASVTTGHTGTDKSFIQLDSSDAGGFIGYISKNISSISFDNCYATGLVEGRNSDSNGKIVKGKDKDGKDVLSEETYAKNTNAGSFAGYIAYNQNISDSAITGIFTSKEVFKSCRVLSGINKSDMPLARILAIETGTVTKDVPAIEEKLDQSSYNSLKSNTGKSSTEAVVYNKFLKSAEGKNTYYPYTNVTGQKVHYGDWPNVIKTTFHETGNRNMIEFDSDSQMAAVLITGLQSGGHVYLVFNNNKVQGDRLLSASSLENIVTSWDGDEPGTVDNSADVHNWQDLLEITPNKSEKAKNDGKYHYSFSLDNLSQTRGFSFYQLAGNEFYYGENLDIRITTSVKKDNDPRNRLYCDKEYVVNSLYETIFDPSVVTGGLEDKSADLSSAEIQRSITNLNFNDGNDLPDEILNNNTVNFTPRCSKENHYAAVIDNCRHLENLNDLISKVDTQNQNGARFVLTNAVQGCDIIWKQLWEGDSSPYNNEYEPYVTELKDNNHGITAIYYEGKQRSKNEYYLPIHLKNNTHLKSYDGGGHKIAGITVSELKEEDEQSKQYGLFGLINTNSSSDNFTIRNLTMEDPQITYAAQAGYLVGHSDRKLTLEKDHITYKYLKNHVLTTTLNQGDCGGLVGDSAAGADITDCDIKADSLTISSTVSEGVSVGGLVGGAEGPVNITNSNIDCSTSLVVRNGQLSGGLIGGSNIISKLTVTGCHVKAPSVTVYSNAGTAYCGGIAAAAKDVNIQNSYVESDQAHIECHGTGEGGYVGGLIGYCNGAVEFSDSHLIGENALIQNDDATNYASGYVGGLAGYVNCTSSFKMSDCYVSAYVYGSHSNSAGGMLGCIKSGDDEAVIEDCYAAGRTKNGVYSYSTSLPSSQDDLSNNPIMNVVGGNVAGGFIGQTESYNLKISNSFSAASVYGTNSAAGFIGVWNNGSVQLTVNNCYSLGRVLGLNQNTQSAGFIGPTSYFDKLKLINCYTLGGINSGLLQIYDHQDVKGILQISAKEPDDRSVNNLYHGEEQTIKTVSYDNALKNTDGSSLNYPYRLYTFENERPKKDETNFEYCYNGDWPTVFSKDGEVAVTGIQLDNNNLNLSLNKTKQLKATLSPLNATNTKVKWNISDSDIAQISENGTTATLTAEKVGTAMVTVTTEDGKFSAYCKVTVSDSDAISATSVNIIESSVKIGINETKQLSATISPAGDYDGRIEWSSENSGVATVSSNGTVTGLSAGTAVITVTVRNQDGNSCSASCQVNVVDTQQESIILDLSSVKLAVGEAINISASFSNNCYLQSVMSNNTDVASADNWGAIHITGKSEGQANVIVTASNGATKTIQVEVTQAQITDSNGTNITNSKVSLQKGSSVRCKITGLSPSTNYSFKVYDGRVNVVKDDDWWKITPNDTGRYDVYVFGDDNVKFASFIIEVSE